MIDFPDLRVSDEEKRSCKRIESELTKRLEDFFQINYGIRPPVRVSGSTEKGTALPRRFFGTDIDIAVQGDSNLVKRIAYPNDVFEGCPLFSMDFFERFTKVFPKVYFAGHRLSGTYKGWQFDFAIADSEKDQWKWDYNNSRFLDFSDAQLEEAKKLKFFLKIFNLAGSEVNGVVGPALELLTFHYGNLNKILGRFSNLSPLEGSFSDHFGTVLFPEEYKALFPDIDDYIHRGLVDSFKYTTPNTYNRLIECAQNLPDSTEDYINSHQPTFNYRRDIPGSHYKMLAHLLSTQLNEQPFFHTEILNMDGGLQVYACLNDFQRRVLDSALDSFEGIPYNQNISYEELPKPMQQDLQRKVGSVAKRYTYFVGKPSLPLSQGKIYIPFDFLLREDCQDLVNVSERGQNGSR
jgi:hypothetical protein